VDPSVNQWSSQLAELLITTSVIAYTLVNCELSVVSGQVVYTSEVVTIIMYVPLMDVLCCVCIVYACDYCCCHRAFVADRPLSSSIGSTSISSGAVNPNSIGVSITISNREV